MNTRPLHQRFGFGNSVPAGPSGVIAVAAGYAHSLALKQDYTDATIAGHNLGSDATTLKLGSLADNGGPTLTMALLPGSPAIGAADSASAPPTDQRGYPRPSGSADIGPYEFGCPPVLATALPPEGGMEISVSGGPGQACWLLASPDLLSWTAIATNSFGPAGTIVFHDSASAGQTQRFYRAVMP